jgi:hypothetical protein
MAAMWSEAVLNNQDSRIAPSGCGPSLTVNDCSIMDADAVLLDTSQSSHHVPPLSIRPMVYSNAAIIAAAVRTWFHIVHRSR